MEKYWIRTGFQINLVGGFNHSEKYMKVSWDQYSQYIYIYMNDNKIHVPNHQPANFCWVAAGSITWNSQPLFDGDVSWLGPPPNKPLPQTQGVLLWNSQTCRTVNVITLW